MEEFRNLKITLRSIVNLTSKKKKSAKMWKMKFKESNRSNKLLSRQNSLKSNH